MNAGVLEKVIPSPVRGDMVVVPICRDQISPVRGGMERSVTRAPNCLKHVTPTGLERRQGTHIECPSPVRGDMVVVTTCHNHIRPVRGATECRAYHGHQ